MLKSAAIAHFGSGAALARALGITKGAVSFWKKHVPEGRAYQIESVTNGVLRVDPKVYSRAPVMHSRRASAAHPS